MQFLPIVKPPTVVVVVFFFNVPETFDIHPMNVELVSCFSSLCLASFNMQYSYVR